MIAHLDGALDAASVPSIRDALLTLTQTALQAGWLIVDLSSVTALDRQGANLLAALSRRAYAADIRLRLRAPSCHLRAVMAAAAARPFLRS